MYKIPMARHYKRTENQEPRTGFGSWFLVLYNKEVPMRVAALYDIHGNLPALEAVLAELETCGVDLIVCGGDVVAGPMPRETLDRLLSLNRPVAYIRGNADRAVVEAFDGKEPAGVPAAAQHIIRWVAQQLDRPQRDVLASWPLLQSVDIDGLGQVLFCHASPRNDIDIFTRITPDSSIQPLLEGVDESTIVVGHTHMQFERYVGGKRLLNAGSVGSPYGKTGAYWLLLGPEVEFRHTTYDLEAAAAEVRATSHPQAEDFAASNILAPLSEEQVFAAFEKLVLK
jgi:putative phosphoesterase